MSAHAFELHITCSVGDKGVMLKCMEALNRTITLKGWSYSQIDGDPVLGTGVKAYLTNYALSYRDADDLLNSMLSFLKQSEVKPLRAKIEFIVYDNRNP